MQYFKSKSGIVLPVASKTVTDNQVLFPESRQDLQKKISGMELQTAVAYIYDVLHLSNQTELHFDKRLQLLSIFKAEVMVLSDRLRNRFTQNDVMDEKIKRYILIINSLKHEMLVGYKIVIDALLNKFICNRKMLLNSLHHASYYCARIIYSSFKQHTTVPSGMWYDFHTIYQVAKKYRLLNKKIGSLIAKSYQINTIQDIYKHYVLLSVINPLRFKHKTVSHFLFLSEVWAPSLIITNKDTSQTRYFVDIHSDRGPVIFSKNEHESKSGLFIDLSAIENRVDTLIEYKISANKSKDNAEYYNVEKDTSVYLLRKLKTAISNECCVKKDREKTSIPVNVIFGIPSILECSNKNNKDLNRQEMQSTDKFIDSDEIDLDFVHASKQASNIHDSASCKMFNSEMINKSTNGCCLKWSDKPVNLNIGEVISIEFEVGVMSNIFGVVRWLRNERDHLICGVEYISNNVLPVYVRKEEMDKLIYTPSLLCYHKNADNHSIKLVTSRFLFKKNDKIEIKNDAYFDEGLLLDEKEISSIYNEFSIDLLNYNLLTKILRSQVE